MSEEEERGRGPEFSSVMAGESAMAVTETFFRGSSSVGNQSWTLEYGQWQIDAETAAHKREQEKKDNDLRRLCFKVILALLVVAFFATAFLGFLYSDQSIRPVAQNAFTTLLGGFIGALAGYFSAKAGA
jgi:hypothetical protein